jgi:hypothetical protein
MLKSLVFALAILILLPGLSIAGGIHGKILFAGDKKQLPPHKTGKYKKACGPFVPNEELMFENNGLANVVIYIEGEVPGGKPKSHFIDQKNCRYYPHVTAMMKDEEIEIRSSDKINHNIHTYSFENDPINIMFTPGQENYTQEMEEPEVVKIECDLHFWMTAWIVVTENSFYNVSGKDGTFQIPDVPPGKYTFTAWHESLGSLSKTITIDSGSANVDFDFSKSKPLPTQK